MAYIGFMVVSVHCYFITICFASSWMMNGKCVFQRKCCHCTIEMYWIFCNSLTQSSGTLSSVLPWMFDRTLDCEASYRFYHRIRLYFSLPQPVFLYAISLSYDRKDQLIVSNPFSMGVLSPLHNWEGLGKDNREFDFDHMMWGLWNAKKICCDSWVSWL